MGYINKMNLIVSIASKLGVLSIDKFRYDA